MGRDKVYLQEKELLKNDTKDIFRQTRHIGICHQKILTKGISKGRRK